MIQCVKYEDHSITNTIFYFPIYFPVGSSQALDENRLLPSHFLRFVIAHLVVFPFPQVVHQNNFIRIPKYNCHNLSCWQFFHLWWRRIFMCPILSRADTFSFSILQSKFCAHRHLRYPLDSHDTVDIFSHIQGSNRFWTSTTVFVICVHTSTFKFNKSVFHNWKRRSRLL